MFSSVQKFSVIHSFIYKVPRFKETSKLREWSRFWNKSFSGSENCLRQSSSAVEAGCSFVSKGLLLWTT